MLEVKILHTIYVLFSRSIFFSNVQIISTIFRLEENKVTSLCAGGSSILKSGNIKTHSFLLGVHKIKS